MKLIFFGLWIAIFYNASTIGVLAQTLGDALNASNLTWTTQMWRQSLRVTSIVWL